MMACRSKCGRSAKASPFNRQGCINGRFAERCQGKKCFKVVADGPLETAVVLQRSTHQQTGLVADAGSLAVDGESSSVGHLVDEAEKVHLVVADSVLTAGR